MAYNMAAPEVHGILALDNEGKRIAVKYYHPSLKGDSNKQQSFESELFKKTSASGGGDGDIILLDNRIVVFQALTEVHIYVVAGHDENELIISAVLTAVVESVQHLLRNQVDKRSLIDNLDLLLLTIDEVVDDGTILETDAGMVTSRVAMRGADSDTPIPEQSFSQALQTARDQLVRSFR